MDEERNESRRKQVAGSIKELIGKLIGNKNIQDEGAQEKAGTSSIRGLGALPVPRPDETS